LLAGFFGLMGGIFEFLLFKIAWPLLRGAWGLWSRFWIAYPHVSGFVLCLMLGIGVMGIPRAAGVGGDLIVWIQSFTPSVPGGLIGGLGGDYAVDNGCNANCQAKIATRRAAIVGIEANELEYVKTRLREEYAKPENAVWHTKRIATCMENWPFYERAQEYTMIPASLLAGKAYVEGIGCQFVNATNGDGGKGPMQITTPENWHEDAVGAMLHENRSWVRKGWKGRLSDPNWNYFVNVLVGAVMLSGYEEQFNSRGVGIFAYNSGPGATRRYMRLAGVQEGQFGNQIISNFRGTIPAGFNDGARPQIYLDRILAGAVMVDRAHRGLPVMDGPWIDQLTLADIPGADPRKDSVR
jgi:hypothetical protein